MEREFLTLEVVDGVEDGGGCWGEEVVVEEGADVFGAGEGCGKGGTGVRLFSGVWEGVGKEKRRVKGKQGGKGSYLASVTMRGMRARKRERWGV